MNDYIHVDMENDIKTNIYVRSEFKEKLYIYYNTRLIHYSTPNKIKIYESKHVTFRYFCQFLCERELPRQQAAAVVDDEDDLVPMIQQMVF